MTTDSTFRPYLRQPFDLARCTLCGECLQRCPVMHMPRRRAKREIERLTVLAQSVAMPACDGPDRLTHVSSQSLQRHNPWRAQPHALDACTSCLACNRFCPEDCRPANLILDLWHQAYLQKGLPARAAYFLPHARPNFRTDICARLPADERAAVERWQQSGPAREFLYAGCNLITTPYLTFSRLFEGVEIRGGLDYCCGEMLFRMGLYEAVEQVAQRLTTWFRRLGAERVYVICTAGLNMLRNILPQFGADLAGIEFVPYYQLLLDKLTAGDLGPLQPLALTVSVQDSCHARTVADGFYGLPRHLLQFLGVMVQEARHSRDEQLCCGIGGGFANSSAYHPFRLLLSARTTSLDQRHTAADATCVYCSGCLEMMSVARLAGPNSRPVFHLLELVQMALGERPRRRQHWLATQFVAGTLRRQFPMLVRRERFWLPELPVEPAATPL